MTLPSSIQILVLRECSLVNDEAIPAFSKLKELTDLILLDTNISDKTVETLFKNLKQLFLPKTITDASVPFLAQMTDLVGLTIYNSPITDITVKALPRLLQMLALPGSQITDNCAPFLASKLHLQELHIWDTALTDACVLSLPPSLTTLSLPESVLISREFREFKQLKELGVSWREASDRFIENLPEGVKTLRMAGTYVPKQVIAKLLQIPSLNKLQLQDSLRTRDIEKMDSKQIIEWVNS